MSLKKNLLCQNFLFNRSLTVYCASLYLYRNYSSDCLLTFPVAISDMGMQRVIFFYYTRISGDPAFHAAIG